MIGQIAEFWSSQASRLMLVYLLIIMAMSLSFSGIIYVTSAGQLERQFVQDVYIDEHGEFRASERVDSYLREQVAEGKNQLIFRLYVLNLVILLFGTAFSFMLARWTLEPIERSVEAQTRFVTDASHEFRTPLTAIKMTNEVALRKKRLSVAEAREVIEGNLEEVDRLQQMSTMLLDLVADDRPLDKKPTPVHDVVAMALTATAPKATKSRIKIEDMTKNPLLMVDSKLAVQALSILLDNAIKYSPPKATITLLTEKLRRGTVAITVKDNGPGIAKDDQKLIFQRFYRTDQARTRQAEGGHGLGLEIALRIAERHGGTIELRSNLGKGSAFSLVLPETKGRTQN